MPGGRATPLPGSPRPGGSTLTTSAPSQASNCVHEVPASYCVISSTRIPSRAAMRSSFLVWPNVYRRGAGSAPAAQPGVGDVADRVAQHVEAEDDRGEREAGPERDTGLLQHELRT